MFLILLGDDFGTKKFWNGSLRLAVLGNSGSVTRSAPWPSGGARGQNMPKPSNYCIYYIILYHFTVPGPSKNLKCLELVGHSWPIKASQVADEPLATTWGV